MTEVGHQLFEFLIVFYHQLSSQEGKSDFDFASVGVDFNKNIPIGALVITKGKSGELYSLILPPSFDKVILI